MADPNATHAEEPRLVSLVCTGNICRSPMAEYMLRSMLGNSSGWRVKSAGTHAVDGCPASPQAVEALREEGIDLSGHMSRFLDSKIVEASDLIVTMTENQAAEIRNRFPRAQERVFKLTSFDAGSGMDIPDPVGSSAEVYRRIRDEIKESLLGLILFLKSSAKKG